MGTLIPEDFSLTSLKNDAERRVVEAFRDGLDDDWLILPDVGITNRHRDHQLDVVLVHREFGVADIEVKGHRVKVRDGVWFSGRDPLEPQPIQQATSNMHALKRLLRRADPSLVRLEVERGVAFPNTATINGDLPPDVLHTQVLTAVELDNVRDAIENLMSYRTRSSRLTEDQVRTIVRTLRPDTEFVSIPDASARAARLRLDQRSADQISVLATLDQNRRVAVTGAAGTGKTRLAIEWARRAWRREHHGERVLLTCYNEPLAAEMAMRLPEDEDGMLVVGAFFQIAQRLEGMPAALPVPEGVVPFDWWTRDLPAHLSAHWDEVTERFDTIVVDEAQDFAPEWIEMLERLLDPDGPARLLLVADARQDLYTRGFEIPTADDGWVRCDLTNNCRNAHAIARLLRRRFDGAIAPAELPYGDGVAAVRAVDIDDAALVVQDELMRLYEEDGQTPESILVVTTASSVRDDLRGRLGLVPWEQGRNGQVVCETAHRAKGLEADTVILVCLDSDVRDELLYVAISRAIGELVVVGPDGLLNRLGLIPG